MLMRGNTGAGKSTFLDTIGLFREGVTSQRLASNANVAEELGSFGASDGFRVLVLEGREALAEYSESAIEADLHAINTFVRSDEGRTTLVVWPINTDSLFDMIWKLGNEIGGTALFGTGTDPDSVFTGPERSEFVSIAERTVSALNEGASLAALGISEDHARDLAEASETVGDYLAQIRDALMANQDRVGNLLPAEQFRMWTLVISGTDTEGDVAALTRGGLAYVDIDRLMTSTGANIVKDLKAYPDVLGILGTMLDAKIVNLDMLTVLAVARTYGDTDLHTAMKDQGMSVAHDKQAAERLASSELGLLMKGESLGTRKRGQKPGDNTQAAFASLAEIARTNDALLNKAIGAALVDGGFVESWEVEAELGTAYTVRSDLRVERAGESIRLEAMWRAKCGRADIANYVLSKLGLYSKAIGLLE